MARAILLAVALSCLAAGPADAQARTVTSLLEARQRDVVVQKFDISCGAAAEATLLHLKFNDDVSERDVALHLMARSEYLQNPNIVRLREGFSLLDLKRYADQRGYRGIGLGQVELADLVAAAPAIVPMRLHGYDHFVVFRGLSDDRVLLADPAFGNRAMRVDRFLDGWTSLPKLGRIAFVIKRPDEP